MLRPRKRERKMTYREFAEKYLDGEVRKQFIANTISLNSCDLINKDVDQPLYLYILRAFVWAASPEGSEYWDNIQQNIKNKKRIYTVHFLTPYCSWEDIQANNEKEAIEKCGIPLEHDGYGQFVAIEQPN